MGFIGALLGMFGVLWMPLYFIAIPMMVIGIVLTAYASWDDRDLRDPNQYKNECYSNSSH